MKNKKLVAFLLLAVLLAAGAFSVLVNAVWNEDEAVHVTPSEIENSTLAVGTHLIHLSALTNELYEIAQDSADESGQNRIYYKSELSDGTWFDITTASSLTDITDGGTPVADSVIAALFFTHHTKSDGVTYDLRTNKAVNIYDIKDPYDIESLDELLPLKNQYEIIKELQGDSTSGKKKIARIEGILKTEVKNETTDHCDEALSALQEYYNVLSENNAPAEELGAVQQVMSATDAARRAQVFSTLETILNEYAQELPKIEDETSDGEEVKEGAAPDTELQAAVNDSLTNVQTSLIEQEGKMLTEGSTVMSALQYEYSEKLIADAESKTHSSCDEDVDALLALSNISESIVSNKTKELSFLDDSLLPRATEQYLSALQAGITPEYTAALSSNSSRAVLQGICDANTNALNIYRNELESYISAKVLRQSNEEAKTFIGNRLVDAQGYSALLPEDPFYDGALKTVESHIDFLSDQLRQLEIASGGNGLDKLIAQKEDLQTQYLSALDKNDLTLAKEYENQIEAVSGQITALEEKQSSELNNAKGTLSGLEEQLKNAEPGSADASNLQKQIAQQKSEISSLEAGMSDGTVGKNVADLKAACLSAIGSSSSGGASSGGSTSGAASRETLSKNIDALGGLLDQNSKIAFPAMQEVYSALVKERDVNGDSSYDGDIAKVENYILNNKAAYDASLQPELSTATISEIADGFLLGQTGGLLDAETGGSSGDGLDVSNLTEYEKQAVYLGALQKYYDETRSGAGKQLLGSVSQKQRNIGNPLVFNRIDNVSGEYIPLTAIASYTNMRYVWNKNQNQGTLARGGTYYAFTVFSDIVKKGKNENSSEKMPQAAKYFNNSVYIPEDYAKNAFETEAVYLTGTSYGVLSSPDLNDLSEQLCELLIAG